MIGILMGIERLNLLPFPFLVRRLFRTSICDITSKWIRDNQNREVQTVFHVIQIQHLNLNTIFNSLSSSYVNKTYVSRVWIFLVGQVLV